MLFPMCLEVLVAADVQRAHAAFLAGESPYDSWADDVASCRDWEVSDCMTSEYLADVVLPYGTGRNHPRIVARAAARWFVLAEAVAS